MLNGACNPAPAWQNLLPLEARQSKIQKVRPRVHSVVHLFKHASFHAGTWCMFVHTPRWHASVQASVAAAASTCLKQQLKDANSAGDMMPILGGKICHRCSTALAHLRHRILLRMCWGLDPLRDHPCGGEACLMCTRAHTQSWGLCPPLACCEFQAVTGVSRVSHNDGTCH